MIRQRCGLSAAEFRALSWDEVLRWADVARDLTERERAAAEAPA